MLSCDCLSFQPHGAQGLWAVGILLFLCRWLMSLSAGLLVPFLPIAHSSEGFDFFFFQGPIDYVVHILKHPFFAVVSVGYRSSWLSSEIRLISNVPKGNLGTSQAFPLRRRHPWLRMGARRRPWASAGWHSAWSSGPNLSCDFPRQVGGWRPAEL
jgi:hypothetical protein